MIYSVYGLNSNILLQFDNVNVALGFFYEKINIDPLQWVNELQTAFI